MSILKKGQVWETNGRRGRLCLKLLEDVDTKSDTFFEAEIREGKAQFASIDYNLAQRVNGLGTRGSVMSFRASLVYFLRQVKP